MDKPIQEKPYCNLAARDLGLDPVGQAGSFDDAILIETPLPWQRDVFNEPGKLPAEAIALRTLWMQRYRETGRFPHRPLLIAPDDVYSRPGCRRVIYFERPNGPFARFTKREYLVPENDLGPLLWALFEAKETLPNFERYRMTEAELSRDLLVCTHGTVDVACAKFGYPLYHHLRDEHASSPAESGLRVWRVSHFGGHIFAPTLIDFPTGHYWAYVGEAQAAQIAQRSGSVAELRGHYRGWAGLESSFAQAAERELWQRLGWAWSEYEKRGDVVAQDEGEAPSWANVELECVVPSGQRNRYSARVEVAERIETRGSTGSEQTHAYPQYKVASLRRR